MGLKQGYFSTRSVSQLISLYGWADSYANTWITSTILYVDMKKGFLKGLALWEHPSRLPRWAERWHKVRGQFYIQLMPSFHHFRKHYLKYHLQHHASHSSKATLPGGCHKKNPHYCKRSKLWISLQLLVLEIAPEDIWSWRHWAQLDSDKCCAKKG